MYFPLSKSSLLHAEIKKKAFKAVLRKTLSKKEKNSIIHEVLSVLKYKL